MYQIPISIYLFHTETEFIPARNPRYYMYQYYVLLEYVCPNQIVCRYSSYSMSRH